MRNKWTRFILMKFKHGLKQLSLLILQGFYTYKKIDFFSIIGIQKECTLQNTALLDVSIPRDDCLSLYIYIKYKLQIVSSNTV